jgi:hypothetical protein
LLASRPTSKLKDHPVSDVHDCLFSASAATLHYLETIRNPRTHHAWWQGPQKMSGVIIWVVTPSNSGEVFRPFTGKHRLHLRGKSEKCRNVEETASRDQTEWRTENHISSAIYTSTLKMEAVGSSKTSKTVPTTTRLQNSEETTVELNCTCIADRTQYVVWMKSGDRAAVEQLVTMRPPIHNKGHIT